MLRRPAETAGGIAGVAVLVAAALGASTEAVAAVGAAAGLLPGAVTYIVDSGGLRGLSAALWRGRR